MLFTSPLPPADISGLVEIDSVGLRLGKAVDLARAM